MSRVFYALTICAILALSGISHNAQAAAKGCNVTNTTIVAFGTYSPISPNPVSSTGTITVECNSSGGNATLALDAGLNSGGAFSNRSMSNGAGSLLHYQLYIDPSHLQVWGDNTQGTQEIAFPYTQKTPVVTTVYGLLPALQSVPAGSYTDTITVTFYF